MTHFQTIAAGGMPFRTYAERGRAVTHVHDDMIVGDELSRQAARDAGLPWLRGGLVEHSGAALPILEATHYPWGASHTGLMADSPIRSKLWAMIMQGEDLPYATNRVDLDPTVRDARGFPVGPGDLPCRAPRARGLRPLRTAAGRHPEGDGGGVDGGHDVAGPGQRRLARGRPREPAQRRARCGWAPTRRTSVVDPLGRMHDLENVVVADSSVFVTSAGYGPDAHPGGPGRPGRPPAGRHPSPT